MKKLSTKISIVIIALAVVVYLLWGRSNGKDLKYRTERIGRGAVSVQVRATGSINPVKTVEVGSQVSGTIAHMYVDFNSRVTKGQVIAIIDSTFLYASVKEAEANLERNQAQLNEAKRALDRTNGLFSKGLVSQADLDAAQTAYESAVASLKQTQASLDRAVVNLRYSVIRAPIDGVVISRDVDVGQTVAASLQAPRLFSIANDLSRMQVEASVDEADIGQVKENLPATFTVDAYPEMQFTGTVSQVRLAPVTVQNVVTYTVIIDVPNPDLKLRPGMTATISILVAKRDDVLRVPTLALRFQPPQETAAKDRQDSRSQDSTSPKQTDRPTGDSSSPREEMRRMHRDSQGGSSSMGGRRQMAQVWLLDKGDKLRQVTFRPGLNDNRYVEMLDGDLKEGDAVIVGTSGGETASNQSGQTNPFQPRMMGPGGGGRGR